MIWCELRPAENWKLCFHTFLSISGTKRPADKTSISDCLLCIIKRVVGVLPNRHHTPTCVVWRQIEKEEFGAPHPACIYLIANSVTIKSSCHIGLSSSKDISVVPGVLHKVSLHFHSAFSFSQRSFLFYLSTQDCISFLLFLVHCFFSRMKAQVFAGLFRNERSFLSSHPAWLLLAWTARKSLFRVFRLARQICQISDEPPLTRVMRKLSWSENLWQTSR